MKEKKKEKKTRPNLFSASLATRSLRNGAEGSGGPLGCASGQGTTAGGATAQGAVALPAAFVAAARELGADAEGADADAEPLFWGGTPRTRTWSAQTTALTPSMAKPIARSRMKTVADSAEAEGVCFFLGSFEKIREREKRRPTSPSSLPPRRGRKKTSSLSFFSLSLSLFSLYLLVPSDRSRGGRGRGGPAASRACACQPEC